MKKYQIIGGQYAKFWYGESDTLIGAKRIATRNPEYWDNWQGWHKPDIYLAGQCREAENFYGKQILPDEFAEPVAVWDGKEWCTP